MPTGAPTTGNSEFGEFVEFESIPWDEAVGSNSEQEGPPDTGEGLALHWHYIVVSLDIRSS